MRPTLVFMFAVLVLGASSLLLVGRVEAEQSLSNRLTVVVQDPAGAVIPGAAVHVQHWIGPDTKGFRGGAERPELVRDADAFADKNGQVTLEIRDWNGEVEVFTSAWAFLPSINTVALNPKGDTRLTIKLSVGREPVF
jgi:hypothetical protein